MKCKKKIQRDCCGEQATINEYFEKKIYDLEKNAIFKEVDPIFVNHPSYNITDENIEQWNLAEKNVQSDWSIEDEGDDAFILNKPKFIVELTEEQYQQLLNANNSEESEEESQVWKSDVIYSIIPSSQQEDIYFYLNGKKYEEGGGNIISITESEYPELPEEDTIYFITDAEDSLGNNVGMFRLNGATYVDETYVAQALNDLYSKYNDLLSKINGLTTN